MMGVRPTDLRSILEQQIGWFKAGGALNVIRAQFAKK
jgi:hypothetical protein